MRFITTVLLCLLGFFSVTAQTEKNDFVEGEVEALILAKKDSKGNIVEDVKVFSPTDIPIICYVDLTSAKPVTVKLNFIAVKVKGVRPNSKIVSVSYKTKNGEDSVEFEGKPEKLWVVGTYRVDILINGKLAIGKEFTVAYKTKK